MKHQRVIAKILCDDVSDAYDLLVDTFPFAGWCLYYNGFWYIVGTECGDVEDPADFRLYEDDVEETLAKVLVCEYTVYTIYGGFDDD